MIHTRHECDGIIHTFDFCTVECHSARRPVSVSRSITLTGRRVRAQSEHGRPNQGEAPPTTSQLLCKLPGALTLIEYVRELHLPPIPHPSLHSFTPLSFFSPSPHNSLPSQQIAGSHFACFISVRTVFPLPFAPCNHFLPEASFFFLFTFCLCPAVSLSSVQSVGVVTITRSC